MGRLNQTQQEAPREPVSDELIDRCKRGDELAWGRLVELTYREVYTLCLRILRDPDDAAEVTQDAYVKAWRGLKSFRGDSQFSTWLYRIASNAAISRYRSRKRRQDHEVASEDLDLSTRPGEASTEGAAGTRVEVDLLERALATLPEHYRTAVLLRDVYGYPIEDIARQMKASVPATKVRIHRGRKKLKELVWPEDGADGGEQG
ncbi:MAG TPA: RNA polymerase sigma factor [Actinomycetota bacterium]|nr:RNA polymerase sigma factor [Actinomycetota bacterium]